MFKHEILKSSSKNCSIPLEKVLLIDLCTTFLDASTNGDREGSDERILAGLVSWILTALSKMSK